MLKNFFEESGGSFIKFGQLLALRVDTLPKEYALELLNLFDNIKTFPYSSIKTTFLQELGAVPEKIFKDFQKVPFASASFGQVHAAKLPDDTIVIVKILRPGIEQDVLVDFLFIDILAFIGDLFFKIEALPWREFAKEFKKWTKNELDYRIEAENAERMYNSTKDENIIIPKTYHRLSTQRILVQEYIDGIPLSRVLRGLKDGRLNTEKLQKLGIDIKKTPRTLVAELLKQYFFNGFFHADPHPGNILLLKDNKIALIDFGIIGDAITYDRKSFVKWFMCGADMDIKQGVYHFAHFSGGYLKNLIGSALPATVAQDSIDDFIHLLAQHFAKTTTQIVMRNVKELEVMNKDYTVVLLEILKAAESLKVKLPKEIAILLRTLSIIGFLAKELDYSFKLAVEVKKFISKYPEEKLIGENIPTPFRRINRERAIEMLNNWLAYLFEKDPSLYNVVNAYISRYNIVKENHG